jgi:DNA invertase Pin-like site-specific DNA recombinase
MTARRTSAEPQRTPIDGQRYGVAYFRVSTVDQANTSYDEDGFSIQAQRDYCQRKAAELGVQLVDEYVDRGKSARTADRPALQAMLTRIKEDTDIQYVFVHKLDRLARNRQDDVQIGLLFAKSGVRLVSCTENIDDSPSGRLVHGIMADIAEWYSANLSEEAQKGMRKKVEHGGTPGNVPIGYVNERHKIVDLGKDIGVVRVHEIYGPIVTECFKRYDSGHYTVDEVAAYANDEGLRLAATRRLPERPLTATHLQRLLHNRYYTGKVIFAGVEYPGEHPPLIDEATFARVEALLEARNRNKDKSRKRPHHLKGILCCARCGRRLGITVPTKRASGLTYPYFYCLGRQTDKNSCPQRYVPIGDIEDAMRAYWATIQIPADQIHTLRTSILASFAGKHEQGQAEVAAARRTITALEQRRKKAKAAYYADGLTLDEFTAEQELIRRGIHTAEQRIATWSIELASITQALDAALALMAHPQALYETLPDGLKSILVNTVFEKVWVLDSAVGGSELTEPFAELLTWEARLAWTTEQTVTETSQRRTYYRMRTTPASLRDMERSWSRPCAERPRGFLPIDRENLRPQGGRGSKIEHMVGVRRFKLNAQLAHYLRERPTPRERLPKQPAPSLPSYHGPRWRVRDRLSHQDIADLVHAFKSGTAKHTLATRYGINERSLKKLLREEGAKRKSRFVIQL